jgi:methylenetetrahydrofolate reductase (NADPH)
MAAQDRPQKKYSFEFFPPRSAETEEKLVHTRQQLAALLPDFFSVTFGAGGSTRDKTLETVLAVREATGIEAAPHLSCIGYALDDLKKVIASYRQHGLRHIVALRGDIPSGAIGSGPLKYASELVELVRAETGDYFHIDVACYPEFHPQAVSAQKDLENFRRKVNAGANGAITQYFYNPDAYFRFIDDCEKAGIDIPIVPGIMPILNREQLIRFSRSCGAEIPLWILRRLEDFADDMDAIQAFGIDVVTELCSSLLSRGAPGLHIYTMNRYAAAEAIWANLGLGNLKK